MMSEVTKAGEWYWGAECPHCKQMAAHTHDPMRGKGDVKAPDGGRMECPNGHQFDAATEDLVRFEWGAQ
jgi:hypothetical protein